MNLIPVVKGALTFVPGVMALRGQGTTGGSDTADYCYGVWLKHVSLLADAGLRGVPPVIAELGPGDSLGTGLCALLSGAERYVALDVVQFANTARNLLVFDRLVQLFRERAPRPTRGWPDFDSLLDARHFPSAVLDEARLSRSLAPDRVAAIRDAIESAGKPDGNGMIEYRVPWSDPSVVRTASVDLIISHSVMEHVGDVEGTYAACASWLRPGGWMSHQVDFSDHGITGQWNGQLAYPDLAWRIVTGRRAFPLNRSLWSQHVAAVERSGFDIRRNIGHAREDGLDSTRVATRFRNASAADLKCSEAFLQAIKR